jgi:uncharacterized membrane protein
MKSVSSHLTRCMTAGLVAILPIGGMIVTVAYFEDSISDTGLQDQPWYFPGLGILLTVVIIYAIGLTITTFVGKWLWKRVDNLLHKLPALGNLYATLKQILGYGEGKDAIFHETVLVPYNHSGGWELGLVTNYVTTPEDEQQLVVFVPGSPNPTAGRLVLLPQSAVRPVDMAVDEALKALVSVGKTDLPGQTPETTPTPELTPQPPKE